MNRSIKFFLFHGQRLLKSYRFRQIIANLQGTLKGRLSIIGDSSLIDPNEEKTAEAQLSQNGFVELPKKIDNELINEIISSTNEFELFDPFNRSFGFFTMDRIPDQTHVANFKREDLIKLNSILKLANDPGVLRVVQGFLGCKPTISNVNMWWSKAGKDKAQDAQLFHRDVDDIKFCKLFIYLTDVGEHDGPHTYVAGSSSTNKLTKIRRYKDEEIFDSFGKSNVIDFIRPKGSCFLVDTYGFHKGTLPIENDRLLLQVQYSINPIGIEDYCKKAKNENFDQYINRLILD